MEVGGRPLFEFARSRAFCFEIFEPIQGWVVDGTDELEVVRCSLIDACPLHKRNLVHRGVRRRDSVSTLGDVRANIAGELL